MKDLHYFICFGIIIDITFGRSIPSSLEELEINLNIKDDFKSKGKQSYKGLDYATPDWEDINNSLSEAKKKIDDVNDLLKGSDYKSGNFTFERESSESDRAVNPSVASKPVTNLLGQTIVTASEPPKQTRGDDDPIKCECNYIKGGCTMVEPFTPEGWACKCWLNWFQSCKGAAWKCHDGMDCPAACDSSQCCGTGQGDCGGYFI